MTITKTGKKNKNSQHEKIFHSQQINENTVMPNCEKLRNKSE